MRNHHQPGDCACSAGEGCAFAQRGRPGWCLAGMGWLGWLGWVWVVARGFHYRVKGSLARDFDPSNRYSSGVTSTASPHWQTSSVALVDAMAAAEARIRREYAGMLARLSELDSRGAASELGYASTTALLMHTLRITRAEARNRIAQAAELHTQTTPTGSVVEAALPHTAAALAEGKISAEHVDVIRRTLKELPDLEPARRDQAEQAMLRQATEDEPRTLARFGARIRDLVDPDGPPPPHDDPVRPERELRRHIRRDGTMDFKGHLDAETAHLFEALLKPFDKSDPGVTEHRDYAERAGDASADVLKLAANCPDVPTHHGM